MKSWLVAGLMVPPLPAAALLAFDTVSAIAGKKGTAGFSGAPQLRLIGTQ